MNTNRVRSELDEAYYERNKLVRFLASLFPSGIAKTDIPGWAPEWHNCVFIDTPAGQMSWHYHDSEAHLFQSLPPYQGVWDGHSTQEKYSRLEKLTNQIPTRNLIGLEIQKAETPIHWSANPAHHMDSRQ